MESERNAFVDLDLKEGRDQLDELCLLMHSVKNEYALLVSIWAVEKAARTELPLELIKIRKEEETKENKMEEMT